MSKNRNRARFSQANNGREYHIMWINEEYPMYWDEGLYFYPKYKRGFVNPNKQIYPSQVREYRTWKYNRKTKWK